MSGTTTDERCRIGWANDRCVLLEGHQGRCKGDGRRVFACYCCGEKCPEYHPDQSAGVNYITMYEGSDTSGCRAIVICCACLEKGDFDMWTEEAEWDSKSPLVPYRLLPPYDHHDPERDNAAKYPSPQELLKPSQDRSETKVRP